jgi:prevent-host-death family protein
VVRREEVSTFQDGNCYGDRSRNSISVACDNLVSMTSPGKTSSAAARRQRSRRTRPWQWQLQEAKARFSEVVRRAKEDGPQHVTVHGREEVVIVGADDFRRLAGDRNGQALVDAMRSAPWPANIDRPRLRMPVRDVDL